jgi:hypothetical protein
MDQSLDLHQKERRGDFLQKLPVIHPVRNMRALQRFRDTNPAVGDYERAAEPVFLNV